MKSNLTSQAYKNQEESKGQKGPSYNFLIIHDITLPLKLEQMRGQEARVSKSSLFATNQSQLPLTTALPPSSA